MLIPFIIPQSSAFNTSCFWGSRKRDGCHTIMPPTRSLTSLTPCLSQYSTIPAATFTDIEGSMKLAVPISIADAPARRNSTASAAEEIPPRPMTGIFTALATCHTIRTATGFTQGPDNPPVTIERRGRRFSISIDMPRRVLISESESAPAASAARAMSAILVTLGDSLTMRCL